LRRLSGTFEQTMKTIGFLILTVFLVGCQTKRQFSRPYGYDLHKAITGADRIVVRDGGQVCCTTPAEMLKQPVYFVVTNVTEISRVVEHMDFEPMLKYNPCLCCGHPGIDWFKGEQRLAITTWKHGYGILMEDGFVGYLTTDSKNWLRTWLQSHGLKEIDME
jgi:hypothetical protein